MKKLNWLRQSYFAHRGFHDKDQGIPENSMLSFEIAIKQGYAIECDVRITADGELVVFHDHTLNRLCGQKESIEDVSFDFLSSLFLLDTNQKIPLLKDVLLLVRGEVPLLIELKTYKNAKKLTTLFMDLMDDYQGTYAVQSFDPRVLMVLKRSHPLVVRGQIAQKDQEKKVKWYFRFLSNIMFSNNFTKPDFINYRISDLPSKKLDFLHKLGVPILSFTARSQKEFDFVCSRYDNAMFEGFHPKK